LKVALKQCRCGKSAKFIDSYGAVLWSIFNCQCDIFVTVMTGEFQRGEMKNPKRAIRRHHISRLKAKRKTYYGHNPLQQTFEGGSEEPLTGKSLGLTVNSPQLCSCAMCGNPRRTGWNSGPDKLTIQERRIGGSHGKARE
jgi:hypothetical protein